MSFISYIVAAAATLGAMAAMQKICAGIDARKFPPPGRLVPIPNGTMHVRQMGEGSPAIILEAGIAASTLNWSLLQPELAQHSATYSYDRAGFGWSVARGKACSLTDIVNSLHATVIALNLPCPYILVGHSFAGLILREYCHSFSR